MRSSLILTLSFAFVKGIQESNEDVRNPTNFKMKHIQQPLDHFNDSKKWRMRYFEDKSNFNNGPICIDIGGEHEGSPQSRSLFAETFTKETKGVHIVTEHRFYGKSELTPVISDLPYLSSRQALADLANLVRHLKRTPEYKSSKVVVVGGSYAGNLAVWMRLLYPELVDAAVASSAPILAKKNFPEFFQTVAEDFKKYGGEDCFNGIVSMMNNLEDNLKTDEGRQLLRKKYSVRKSDDLANPFCQSKLAARLYGKFQLAAMFAMDLKKECKQLISNIHYTPEHTFPVRMTLGDIVAWLYQTCTEFGYFHTTSSKTQPFNLIPVEYYERKCWRLFRIDKETVERSVEETNRFYGGLNPNVTRVVFTNGELDPWRMLSPEQGLSPEFQSPGFVIPKGGHCSDLHNVTTPVSRKVLTLLKVYIGFPP